MSAAGATDAVAFLSRLLRLDPAATVRLVPAPDGRTALWAPLPWDVLVTRLVEVTAPAGVQPASGLLSALESGGVPEAGGGAIATAAWRWGLPPSPGEAVERIPAADLRRVGAAAARTLREVSEGGLAGRAVGQRAVRDALLDHVAVTVEAAGRRVAVPQRLVQAVTRMGFITPSPSVHEHVTVRVAAGWVALVADYGTAWWRRSSGLTLTPVR
jgi:hypothetical protein